MGLITKSNVLKGGGGGGITEGHCLFQKMISKLGRGVLEWGFNREGGLKTMFYSTQQLVSYETYQ